MKEQWIVTLINNKKYETPCIRTEDGCMLLYKEEKKQFEKVEKKIFSTKRTPMIQTTRIYTHVFPFHQIKSAILEEVK